MTEKNYYGDLLKDFDNSLKENDLEDLENYGFQFKKPVRKKDPDFNQKYVSLKFKYGELISIKPEKPMFAPGTIIGCQNKEQDDDDGLMGGFALKADSLEDELSFDFKENDKKGSFQRILETKLIMNATAMVMEEVIEIKKIVVLTNGFDSYKKGENKNTVFHVTHLLHVLDQNEKIVIPTTLFGTNVSSKIRRKRRNTETTLFIEDDKLDLDMIKKIYETSDPNSVIQPLSILSKP